jgi:hypothetical protein
MTLLERHLLVGLFLTGKYEGKFSKSQRNFKINAFPRTVAAVKYITIS